MSQKPGQPRIGKQNWPLSSHAKPVRAPTLMFSQEKKSHVGLFFFLKNSKMFDNSDFHIPQ